MLTRTALVAAAATMAAAAFAPAAQAWTTQFTFATQTGSAARVEVVAYDFTRLELMREGVAIKQSSADFLEIDLFKAGDVANLYDGDVLVASATYDGLPSIGDGACLGRGAFPAKRAANAQVIDAGAYQMFAGSPRRLGSIWTWDESFAVTLERPLAVGDVAYLKTEATVGSTEIISFRGQQVLQCPDFGRRPPGTPGEAAPAPATSPAAPSSTQVLVAVRASVSASRTGLKALSPRAASRRATITLPFAFPEPGTVSLELLAKNRVIGTGTKTLRVNGKANVAVKLSRSGRALLKRSKQLKVTLRGTFTPSRAGAGPQRASMSVTLR